MTSLTRSESDRFKMDLKRCPVSALPLLVFFCCNFSLFCFNLFRFQTRVDSVWTARCLVSLGREQAVLLMLEGTYILREPALGVSVCITFQITPLYLGRWKGTTRVILSERECFLPQEQQFPSLPYFIVFTAPHYLGTSVTLKLCFSSDFQFVVRVTSGPLHLGSLMSVIIFKGLHILLKMMVFKTKVNKLQ